jgi:hypothetical protein
MGPIKTQKNCAITKLTLNYVHINELQCLLVIRDELKSKLLDRSAH